MPFCPRTGSPPKATAASADGVVIEEQPVIVDDISEYKLAEASNATHD